MQKKWKELLHRILKPHMDQNSVWISRNIKRTCWLCFLSGAGGGAAWAGKACLLSASHAVDFLSSNLCRQIWD